MTAWFLNEIKFKKELVEKRRVLVLQIFTMVNKMHYPTYLARITKKKMPILLQQRQVSVSEKSYYHVYVCVNLKISSKYLLISKPTIQQINVICSAAQKHQNYIHVTTYVMQVLNIYTLNDRSFNPNCAVTSYTRMCSTYNPYPYVHTPLRSLQNHINRQIKLINLTYKMPRQRK